MGTLFQSDNPAAASKGVTFIGRLCSFSFKALNFQQDPFRVAVSSQCVLWKERCLCRLRFCWVTMNLTFARPSRCQFALRSCHQQQLKSRPLPGQAPEGPILDFADKSSMQQNSTIVSSLVGTHIFQRHFSGLWQPFFAEVVLQ